MSRDTLLGLIALPGVVVMWIANAYVEAVNEFGAWWEAAA